MQSGLHTSNVRTSPSLDSPPPPAEWRLLTEERFWKTQTSARDREIKYLELKIRGYERRPLVVIRRRRLQAMFQQWHQQVGGAATASHLV